jgi:hypothetical protein
MLAFFANIKVIGAIVAVLAFAGMLGGVYFKGRADVTTKYELMLAQVKADALADRDRIESVYAANTQKVDQDYVAEIARINRGFAAAWSKHERLLVAKCAKRNLPQAPAPTSDVDGTGARAERDGSVYVDFGGVEDKTRSLAMRYDECRAREAALQQYSRSCSGMAERP